MQALLLLKACCNFGFAQNCCMQQLDCSSSSAAIKGLAGNPAAEAENLVRLLRCSSNPVEPLADFLTSLRSPDAEAVAAAAASAGVIEVLERLLRGEIGSVEEDAAQALAAAAMTRLIEHNGGDALAKLISDKGAVIVGPGRGSSGAAPLKPWPDSDLNCARYLAEG
jgi:hypothetical protein